MRLDTSLQNLLFWVSLFYGAFFGAIYDLLRVIRWFLFGGRLAVFIQDFVYCVFVGIMMSVLFYNYSAGRIRLYALVCAAVGFLLYYFTIGRLIYGVCLYIRNTFKKIADSVLSAVLRKYRNIYGIAYSRIKIRTACSKAKRGFDII